MLLLQDLAVAPAGQLLYLTLSVEVRSNLPTRIENDPEVGSDRSCGGGIPS